MGKNGKIKVLVSLFLLITGTGVRVYAQSTGPVLPEGVTCDSLARFYRAQPFFCACEFESHTFAFPIDTVLSDTVWFTASAADLTRGISAYWFSTTAVTMEVYALCVSTEPTFTLTIGGNQMREMDVSRINQKLSEMGDAVAYLKNLTPHIRAYPHNGGSGRVYCYPYDEGPLGTCEDSIPIRHGMTYVCSRPENVYRLPWENMSSKGQAFIRWRQMDKNKPADFWLTRSTCDGEEVARAVLSDSIHVFQLDSEMLVTARKEKQDLWLHVKHEEGITGRFWYYNNPKWAETAPDFAATECEGKAVTVNMRSYSADTVFTDVLWVARDTLRTQEVNLAFTQPEMKYDTVNVDPNALARGYVHALTNKVFYNYGDTVVDVVKKNSCTQRYQITIQNLNKDEAISMPEAPAGATRKAVRNGQMVILKDDRIFNVLGQQIDNK